MKGSIFIDTNVFVYATLKNNNEKSKYHTAVEFLDKISDRVSVISTQDLNEFHSALIKHKVSESEIQNRLNSLITNNVVSLIKISTIKESWRIRATYHFSLWDCLIIAAAIESNCTELYTEDLQHNQLIDNKLRILNPFL